MPSGPSIWRHPRLSVREKLLTSIVFGAGPMRKFAGLRYPEDRQEIERLRASANFHLELGYKMICTYYGWSRREVAYARADGSRGTILVHRPKGMDGALLPLIFYVHGGGFTVGSALDPFGALMAGRLLASGVPVAWASVEYRLAPEHPAPTAAEDCAEGLERLLDAPGEHGLDAGAVHIAGSSAGGNLAAATMVRAVRRYGGAIKSVFLCCPFLDPLCNSESYAANHSLFPGTGYLRWCWDMYLRNTPLGDALNDGRCCPGRLAKFEVPLPPIIVVTGECDPLHDEGAAYAATLRALGADVFHVETRSSHCLWQVFDGAARKKAMSRWTELVAGRGGATIGARL